MDKNTQSMNMILAERIKKEDSKILLPSGMSTDVVGDFLEVKILRIGVTIPKEDLGNDNIRLEEGDTAFIQYFPPEIEAVRTVVYKQQPFILIQPHDIMWFEKGK